MKSGHNPNRWHDQQISRASSGLCDFFVSGDDGLWQGDVKLTHDSALEVSGNSLQTTNHELAHLRLEQKKLRVCFNFDQQVFEALAQLVGRDWGYLEDRGNEPENTPFYSFFFDAPLIAHCASWKHLAQKLQELARAAARIADRIVKLTRRVRAIKRAMRRRQRIIFCGLDQMKKVWFLLHGSHPPKDISTRRVDILVGRAWT